MSFTDCDIHIHTNLSLCARSEATPEANIQTAKSANLKLIGFANHYWDERVPGPNGFYEPQDTAHVLKLKENWETLEELAGSELKLLFGCETEFAHGDLGITEERATLFDYVLVPHSHTHMRGFVLPEGEESPEKHAAYLVRSFLALASHPMAKRWITGIVHPFYPCGTYGDEVTKIFQNISDAAFSEAAAAAKENDIAIELNASSFTQVPPAALQEYHRFFAACQKAGCKFFAGSDLHQPVFSPNSSSFFWLERVADAWGIENRLTPEELWAGRVKAR